MSERRKLKEFPLLSVEALEKGKFGEEFEEYALDHFPFREGFRGLKTVVSQKVFGNRDQRGLYSKEGYLVKMEYPLNMEMLEYAGEKLQGIYERYLKDTGSKCYLTIIPDKNYFLGPKYGKLTMDYSSLITYLSKKLSFAGYLDITRLLSIEDFYKTDTHWRQEMLTDVAVYLAEEMGATVTTEYKKIKADKSFLGVYAGQWSLPQKGENLYYLTNEILEKCKVYSIGENKEISAGIYDVEKINSKEPYDLFLSGTNAILSIENPQADTERELIIFRDSFGSSLAPLLVPGYSKITLVDIRYVQSNILDRYIEFRGQDVLFLYSTLILNQSRSFK